MRSERNPTRRLLPPWGPSLTVCTLALLTMTGCFGLGRGAPVQRHYVLGLGPVQPGSPPVETAEAVERGAGPTMGIRALRMARYLDTPLIVVRRGEHRIELSEFHRWGEPLREGVPQTVAAHLEALRPGFGVEVAPWSSPARHDWVIQLQLLSFEGSVAGDDPATVGEALVVATWEIGRGADGAVVARGTTEYRGEGWPVGDYDALLELLEAGLNRLAGDLARALEGVTQAATPPPSAPPHPRTGAGRADGQEVP